MRFGKLAFTLVVTLLAFNGSTSAHVVRVPADEPTIEAAVVATSPGDTILVAPGRHPVEHVIWLMEPKVLLSEAGAEYTEIYGPVNPLIIAPFLIWLSAEDDDLTEVRGFTISVLYDFFGIRCDGLRGSPRVIDNVVMAMICLQTFNDCAPIITGNSLLAHNRGIEHGICFQAADAQPTLERNLLVGGYYGVLCGPNVELTMSCNNVWEHTYNYSGHCGDLTGVDGNISEDPFFCDRYADHHLRSDSPCLEGYGCGRMGALEVGCFATATEAVTWGRLRCRFR